MIEIDVIKERGIVALAVLAVLAGAKINMSAQSGSVDEELIKKTGATSIIWTWFGFKAAKHNLQDMPSV